MSNFNKDKFNQLLRELESLKFNLYNKDFLLTWDKSQDEILATLKVVEALKTLFEGNISTRVFDTGLAVSQFRDNSTRTRFSFGSACSMLGLTVQDLDEGKSQIAHGETVRETSNMISFLTEVVGIRDDMYLGAGHAYMKEVAQSLENGYKEGVLNQRPAVVNLQCDVDHPTQSMADLAHLQNYFGSLENLKGKKIAMTWAYSPSYGKPLSVPQGIIGLMTRFGMDVTLAYPEGYSLIQDCADIAGKNAANSGGKFQIVNSMEDAFKNADIVYPKSWAPYHVMEQRTKLLRTNDSAGLKDLEKSCLANNAKYKSWECTEEKMKLTKNGKALYMHCLPADISGVSCKEGEVQASVFDRYRVETYKEAGYKPFVIAAMIFLARFGNPVKLLNSLQQANKPRAAL
ncbi:MAG: knotted carbamoyltransferase YgeW [Bdellovibrionales bacterium GWC1_52_8]|nr:MAG: knotted carbamoyltransferase YgeW [Bdellovibrionales bacterium GWB1_52_6]OFZ04276.1 MAG: knotted carbamoyltransferase YgeW [Bdellovibrionales bacterium GWA1_52_35]OFZ43529.1 MAG: knotted carbamoyltransferase YgeW [Bdellovibrionales bacterium GWC1_52_8]HCM40877.1 knotted carbamoyltransferase YgeW [Bdellovibrionales bacterium]